MRVANSIHEANPWRIRGIASDFILEDVWALPVHGGPDDFPKVLDTFLSADPTELPSLPSRLLWGARDQLGRCLNLGRISTTADDSDRLPIPGTSEISLSGRLPEDLRNTTGDMHFGSLPFVPLYRTDDEFAAEISNRTVHGVMHLAWVDQGDGRFRGQMAVYVKPRGRLGQAYMAFIKPFRYLIIYPAMMRQIERRWEARVAR